MSLLTSREAHNALVARASRRIIGVVRKLTAVVLACALALSSAGASAREPRELMEDLRRGEDFRLRTSAALSLGKSGARDAREPLERALADDDHPMVRASAAAALGALGDPAALPALERAASSDAASSVKTAASKSIELLKKKGKKAGAAKVLLKLGKMENKSGVRGEALARVLSGATRERANTLPGVEVLGDDSDAKAVASARKLPVLVVDGSVKSVAHSSGASGVVMSAKVEFVLKKESALKASMSGSAQALGDGDPSDAKRLENLQDAAIAGAVESALKNPDALVLAAK